MTAMVLTDMVKVALPKDGIFNRSYSCIREYIGDCVVYLVSKGASGAYDMGNTDQVDVDYSRMRISTTCDAGVSVENRF